MALFNQKIGRERKFGAFGGEQMRAVGYLGGRLYDHTPNHRY